jgi:hypothetical protein
MFEIAIKVVCGILIVFMSTPSAYMREKQKLQYVIYICSLLLSSLCLFFMRFLEKSNHLRRSYRIGIFLIEKKKPELLKALEANMFDHHENEALEAEAFLKGQAKGMEKGARQERKKNDVLTSKRADFLRSQNVPDSVIAAMLALK